jgi:hypothetical protein
MSANYTPTLSVDSARYSPHEYSVRFTALSGWTLSVTRRIENGLPVYTTSEEQETCLLVSKEEAQELIASWEFALQAEALEMQDEAELLSREQAL